MPFVQVRPRGDREMANRTVNLGYTADEGARVYVERINITGNTRTRDYVIRREFDLGEGDAYNKALVDRAERRLKALTYFKNVRITQAPAPRRTASSSTSRSRISPRPVLDRRGLFDVR